jgi:hypothetical protein
VFVFGTSPVPIADGDTSITDVDSTSLASATVVLTNAQAGDVLSIAGTLPAGITASIDTSVPGQITMTLAGSASLSDYQTALEQIRFENPTNPSTTTRVLTAVVSDGTAGSNLATSRITVPASSTLSGDVYRDTGDGVRQAGETGIQGVTLTLMGVSLLGTTVSRTVVTDATGFYQFVGLPASNGAGYTITQTEPGLYQDGGVNVGVINGTPTGSANPVAGGDDFISAVVIGQGVTGTEYSFAEINLPPVLTLGPDIFFEACGIWPISRLASFTDANADGPWTATVDYGDGTGVQALALSATKTFTLAHNYLRAGLYQVTVTLRDNFGQSTTSSLLVGANRQLPQAFGSLVTINDGAAQRSMVAQLTITFPEEMILQPGALAVETAAGVNIPIRTIERTINGKTVVVIEFTGSLLGGSLADGNYKVKINGSKVQTRGGPAAGTLFNGGAIYTETFFRFYGDSDGDRDVDTTDLTAFRAALRSMRGTAAYRWYFDYDADCDVDAVDYQQFLLRNTKKLAP